MIHLREFASPLVRRSGSGLNSIHRQRFECGNYGNPRRTEVEVEKKGGSKMDASLEVHSKRKNLVPSYSSPDGGCSPRVPGEHEISVILLYVHPRSCGADVECRFGMNFPPGSQVIDNRLKWTTAHRGNRQSHPFYRIMRRWSLEEGYTLRKSEYLIQRGLDLFQFILINREYLKQAEKIRMCAGQHGSLG